LNNNSLLDVCSLFPSRSPRWVSDLCRSGRLPGAIKVARVWFIAPANWQAWLARQGAAAGVVSTVSPESAEADLRKRGVAA
jgi:hypothetical protein